MKSINISQIESEAAIYAEGTHYTRDDILRHYRDYLEYTISDSPLDIQRFCEEILGIRDGKYQIAFMLEATGEFEVIEDFEAADDDAANEYAEQHYGDREWYVLDSAGNNINGGPHQDD